MTKKTLKKEIIKNDIEKNDNKSVPVIINKHKTEIVATTKDDKKDLAINETKEENKIQNIFPIKTEDSLDYKNKSEALLFSAGKKLEFEFILQTIGAKDKNALKNALLELKKEYDERKSPLMIVEDANFWKILVREKYSSIARKINSEMELSKTMMETLAVIAWKTPILQSEVIRIRTNKAYDHIDELIASGFITKEKKGRSFILKITQKFYDYFDVEGKEDIRKVFSKIKEAPGQKKVDEFKENKIETNSPQKTLGNLKIIDTTPDNSVKQAEEDMGKIKYGKLEVYDENNLVENKDINNLKIDDEKNNDQKIVFENRKIESYEEEKLEKKTKEIVKKLLEDDK